MAAPPSVTTKNMTGKYVLNKTLSDSSDATLKMQNVGWLVRQAVAWSTINVEMKHYKDEKDGHDHVDIFSVSTGGIKDDQTWILSGEDVEAQNKIWGSIKGHFGFIKFEDIEDQYLKEGWEVDGDTELIRGYQASQTDTWTAEQIIGFAVVDGQRRQARRVLSKKGDQTERIRMIYDWKS